MGDLIGILLLLLILFIGGIFVLVALMRAVFRGVAKVGSGVAYHGVKAVAGDEFAQKHERTIRGAGSAVGLIGGAMLGAEIADFDGFEDVDPDGGAAIGIESLSEGASDSYTVLPAEPIDIDGDGIIDGYDLDGNGVIDHNAEGTGVGEITEVREYRRSDGTVVRAHIRTLPDDTTLNNLRPS